MGVILFFTLILLGVLISFNLNQNFISLLSLYAFLTFSYSKFLKRLVIIDIMTLTGLYLLRLVIGGVVNEISLSTWLVAFSTLFFLSLSSIKRQTELSKKIASVKMNISGRGYQSNDLSFISQLSSVSGYLSILIIMLYIGSESATGYYTNSIFLWFIPFILIYWVSNILLKTQRGEMHDDPVVFALKDKASYICVILIVVTIIFAM